MVDERNARRRPGKPVVVAAVVIGILLIGALIYGIGSGTRYGRPQPMASSGTARSMHRAPPY